VLGYTGRAAQSMDRVARGGREHAVDPSFVLGLIVLRP
jgi:hypothetical protein